MKFSPEPETSMSMGMSSVLLLQNGSQILDCEVGIWYSFCFENHRCKKTKATGGNLVLMGIRTSIDSSNTSILNLHSCLEREKQIQKQIPIRIMHGIFTYIWLTFMVNVGKYIIHGSLIIWYRTHIFHLHVCLK